MSEKAILHLICFCGTVLIGLTWLAGYLSGGHGWWWTGIGVFGVYAIILGILGGHGH